MTKRELVFAIPGDLTTPAGGYAYDRRVIAELTSRGWSVTHLALGDSFPTPIPKDATHAIRVLQDISPDTPVLIDGLAFGALESAAVAQISSPLVALVHHPLAYEGTHDETTRDHLLRTERDNLAHADGVIVTSPQTAALLREEYGVPADQLFVAEPGTDQQSSPPTPQTPPLILAVGSLIPRKGHDVLLRALSALTDLSWQAVIVGSAGDSEYSASLEALRDELSLGDRVAFRGAVDSNELSRLYAEASIFALATRYEGYGMVFAEAMAHGLPIVSCHTGAVPDTVAQGAGRLVPVDSVNEFAGAVRQVLSDPGLADSLAAASATAGAKLPGWDHTADIVEKALERVRRDENEARS
jgi:glycosyltransferase involved in cell wall biosynthesis